MIRLCPSAFGSACIILGLTVNAFCRTAVPQCTLCSSAVIGLLYKAHPNGCRHTNTKKKINKKFTPLGVKLMTSQVLYWAAQGYKSYTAVHNLYSHSSDTLVIDAERHSLVFSFLFFSFLFFSFLFFSFLTLLFSLSRESAMATHMEHQASLPCTGLTSCWTNSCALTSWR